MNSSGDTSGNPKKDRTLLLLVGLFLLPALVALAMYWFSMRPGIAHHGDLISPPQPLHAPLMLTWLNQPFPTTGLRGKWSLLYVVASSCGEQCVDNLYLMQQAHTALGKEKGRVQRILLADTPDVARLDVIQRDHPDLIILARPVQAVAEMAGQFAMQGKTGGGIYLIDPQGNAMMHYAPGIGPEGMHQDLKRLLKYSWAG